MTSATRKSGFFRAAVKALVAARERKAESYVNGVLLTFDDETLTSLGYSRDELSRRGISHARWL